ncbi:MAG: ComEC/Rec2 family competence protein [Epsilonproteobacteria bacterium]|nr:ComEC/Rec2 family competence protein [Campylobacterota bacterium]
MHLEKTKFILTYRFGFFIFLLFFYSLIIHYQEYKNFTRFDTITVDAVVLTSYKKQNKSTKYKLVKLKIDDGIIFYSKFKKNINNLTEKKFTLKIYTNRVSFYGYLTSFYSYSKILKIKKLDTLKQKLNHFIASQHTDKNMTNIYQALFSATPLNKELQQSFSYLGISHLFAISGFHLSVLSALLFFMLRPIYSFFQYKYFPYRNANIDLFLFISFLLLSYLIFLDSPPSLLRSYFMLMIGFILYDRGIKVISMQTLALSVIFLLAIFIKLIFSLGFWLSVGGVFYIFLFFILFKNISKVYKFILLPVWIYITMLPYSLSIFGNFSIYHPLSIVWTLLFSFFYPLSILLHLVGYGDLLDHNLYKLLHLSGEHIELTINMAWLYLYMFLSLLLCWFL